MGLKWYTNKCVVCGQKVSQNSIEILQPEIFVCWNCTENARQMLAIKKFAKEVNVKIDIGMVKENDIHEIKSSFGLMEAKDNG